MPLSPEELSIIQTSLNARAIQNRCDVCGHANTMGIVPETAQVPMAYAPTAIGAGAIPCAVIVCNHCGHTRFHALGPLGLQNLGSRRGP